MIFYFSLTETGKMEIFYLSLVNGTRSKKNHIGLCFFFRKKNDVDNLTLFLCIRKSKGNKAPLP